MPRLRHAAQALPFDFRDRFPAIGLNALFLSHDGIYRTHMKILVLHSELGVLRGGGENFTRNLFAAFNRRGHQVTASFVANRRGEYPFNLPAGIQAIPIRGWWSRQLGQAPLIWIGSWIPPKSRLKYQWDHIRGAIGWRVHRWHERRFQRRAEREFAGRWNEFDAVYVHGSETLASSFARHRPTVLRLPGPASPDLARVLYTVTAVCANGDALVQVRGFLGDHAIELPVGVDTDNFSPGPTSVRQLLGWAQEDCVVGYVGRLIHVKGVDLLATAFHDIARAVPGTRLLIVGSGEEESVIRSVLKQEIARGLVHVESDVPHQRLAEWYRAMNLLVMPSRYENFSNSVLEALACGVPFLASDVGGNRILAKAVGCWLFQENSASSLNTSLRHILRNVEELKSCGALGVEFVRREFSWAASAKRLEQILVSCSEKKG